MAILRTFILVFVGLILLVGSAVTAFGLYQERREAQRSLVVRVEPGTAAMLAAGEPLELFPLELTLRLGEQDTLVVQNDDVEPVTIGPYRVAPGQRFVQRYESPGIFELYCSLHGDENLRIVVIR
ncbi:cupredoxin domain-containing protein [Candidatus Viridilinea mediisalina]|uniref:EfeO-type cupredoxin-like domain-containing protein n=1 Tax=Candidatus Viridilinea mediisalina TaxID=2024553 RepID=A0A2A6RIN8_9CHLR|nr:hypothetical protein [Candidatus Viridilinea mediisalina]PDW02749.1 hypothetical protein CJ255_12325 [Candidatus Viridilinea mediisalina]